MMTLPDITQTLLACKKAKGSALLTWSRLSAGRGLHRGHYLPPGDRHADEAQKLTQALGLGPEVAEELTEYPTKGLGPVVPTDPLVYRFYEIMQVYGMPLKSVVQEKFGDGIMSPLTSPCTSRRWKTPKATGSN